MMGDDWIQPGTLWSRVVAQTQHALACSALHPIATHYDWVEQNGIRFLVRVLANLQRKDKAKRDQKRRKDFNPFLPYEADLFVADLSPTHLVLLNKFNVMDHHILIVTRAFESQDSLLTEADFQALALGLSEIDGLAFYNGGKTAGASQPHKHLQIVPLPFVPDGSPLPLDPYMTEIVLNGTMGRNSQLPYRHAIAPLDAIDFAQPLIVAPLLYHLYQQLLQTLHLLPEDAEPQQPRQAYNLLATRRWLALVPRSQERFGKIEVNSLGFAGALLVKTPDLLDEVREVGPLTVLTAVGEAV
ncbi:MAG: DUF4922 domain-containing protein [Thermosynechococcaceae cyanobacterium]